MEEGAEAGLPGTLEECLETLSILPDHPGAEPSGTFSFWRSQGELGDAPGRCHCVNAEYLGILNILEQEQEVRPRPLPPASGLPTKNSIQRQKYFYPSSSRLGQTIDISSTGTTH